MQVKFRSTHVKQRGALNPIWKCIGGGCNLNRPIDKLVQEAGFQIGRKENGYMDGNSPLSYLFRGIAQKR